MGIHYDRQRLTPPMPGKTHTGKHILHTPHKTALFHGEPISPRAHLAKKPARFFHSSKPFQRRLRTALRFLLRNGWPQAPVFSRRPEHKRKFRRAARLKDVFTQKYVSAAHNSPSSFLRRPYQNEFQRWYLPPRALPSAPAAENFMLHQVSRTIGSAALRSRNGGRAARLNRGKTASHRSALPGRA